MDYVERPPLGFSPEHYELRRYLGLDPSSDPTIDLTGLAPEVVLGAIARASEEERYSFARAEGEWHSGWEGEWRDHSYRQREARDYLASIAIRHGIDPDKIKSIIDDSFQLDFSEDDEYRVYPCDPTLGW